MDRHDTQETLEDAAEREGDEAASLKMLAEADEKALETAALARSDRAVALELELEADYLREKARRKCVTPAPAGEG